MQLATRNSRSGFLPLLVAVADEDFAPGMGLLAVDLSGDRSGGCRLEEAHAGFGCGPRLDRTILHTPQRLHGADAVEVEASDSCCWSVALRHVRDVDVLAPSRCIATTAAIV